MDRSKTSSSCRAARIARLLDLERRLGWLHPALRGDEVVALRALLYAVVASCSPLLACLISIPYFQTGETALGLLTLLFGGVALSALWALRWRGTLSWAANLLCVALLGAVVSGYMVLGGVNSYSNKWLAVLPLLGFFSHRRALGLLWSAIAVLTVPVCEALVRLEVMPARLIFEPEQLAQMDLFNSIFFLLFFGLDVAVIHAHHLWVVERIRDKEELITKQNETLLLTRDELLAAVHAKDRFLANMSHELRTPLNAMLGYSDLIQEELLEGGGEAFQKEFAAIRCAGEALLEMLEDILELTRFESGGELHLEYEPVDIEALVRRALRGFEARPIAFHVDRSAAPAVVVTHAESLERVLSKLLDNACKFTPPEARVAVHLFGARQELILEVKDEGPGIETIHHERIWEPFGQVDASATRTKEGPGLGLSLVKHFGELLCGRLEFESAPGQGTSVRLALPRGLDAQSCRSAATNL